MPSVSFKTLTRKIKTLQAEADALKKKETSAVISRIKEAIEHYDLTAADLGFGASVKGAYGKKATKGRKASASRPVYSDSNGNSWSGHGRRPKWFLDAIASGMTPEQLKSSSDSKSSVVEAPKSAVTAKRGRKAARVGFKDENGNSWSGKGRRPAWFLKAIESGKTPEQLKA